MSLWRFVIQGFGWRVGSELADEAIKKARDEAKPEQPTDAATKRRAERALARQARRAAKAQQKAERAKNKRIEAELAVLKKRAADDK